MNHPSQLNIFTAASPSTIVEAPQVQVRDFKDWRSGDLLDLIELTVELIQSDDHDRSTQSLLEMANELRLPSSVTTLLLNSLSRLERLLLTKNEEQVSSEVRDIPSVVVLAKQCGLGGVFSRDIDAIWNGKPVVKPSVQEIKLEQPQPVKMPTVDEVPTESQYVTAKITTNQTLTGRQWKIGGQLIAEVVLIDGIGHVGKLYAGSHVTPLKPYREYATAADQCRSYTEGILKFIKTIPK